MDDPPVLQLLGFVIDCPNALALATFYAEVTGHALIDGSDEASAGLHVGEAELTVQRVEDYRPPRWPEGQHPKQYHLDFEMDLMDSEHLRVVQLGATLEADHIGPEGYGWRVYADPAGHPFCLCHHREVRWTESKVTWS